MEFELIIFMMMMLFCQPFRICIFFKKGYFLNVYVCVVFEENVGRNAWGIVKNTLGYVWLPIMLISWWYQA